jgi:hypothetical protein
VVKEARAARAARVRGPGQGWTRDEGTTKDQSDYYANSGDYKKKTIGNTDNPQFLTLVNSTSTAPPIGLPPKETKFCHTLKIYW